MLSLSLFSDNFPFFQLHSEYRSTYRWHEYTPRQQQVVSRTPQPLHGAGADGDGDGDGDGLPLTLTNAMHTPSDVGRRNRWLRLLPTQETS